MTPGLWLSLPLVPTKSIKVIGGERADISQVGVVDHLTHHRDRDLLPVSVTRAWLVKGGHHEEWERNHTEQSIFSDGVMEGVSFPSPVTPERHPAALPLTTVMNLLAPPGCEVRVEWHLVFLSVCHSGWCRLIVAQWDVCGCVCASGGGVHYGGSTVAILLTNVCGTVSQSPCVGSDWWMCTLISKCPLHLHIQDSESVF